MNLLNLLIFAVGTVVLGASFFWTLSRWRSRGGLKVPFFQDRLSCNVWHIAGVILGICVLTVAVINVALLCSGSENSVPIASNMVLFVLSSVLFSLADVEGCYGAGIYVRTGSHMTRVDRGNVTPGRGKVQIDLDGTRSERYYLPTKRTLAAIYGGKS